MLFRSKLLLEEEEFTVMRVTIEGIKDGQRKKIVYNLLDRYDKLTQTSSMARTTGYTATAAANLILEQMFTRKGLCPPEYVGKDAKCFEFVLKYLAERNIIYKL